MDFKKVINGGIVDFSINKNQLEVSDGLEDAILNSLFTNARANGQNGWWGDAYNNQNIGSKLWTLKNAKATTQTKNLAKQYCLDALVWLVDDKIADKITVETSWIGEGVLYIEVNLYQNNKNKLFTFKEAI